MPGPNSRRQKMEKPKDAVKTIKKIFSYLAESKWLLFLVVFFVIISASAQVAGTYFLKPLINDYIHPFNRQEQSRPLRVYPALGSYGTCVCFWRGLHISLQPPDAACFYKNAF